LKGLRRRDVLCTDTARARTHTHTHTHIHTYNIYNTYIYIYIFVDKYNTNRGERATSDMYRSIYARTVVPITSLPIIIIYICSYSYYTYTQDSTYIVSILYRVGMTAEEILGLHIIYYCINTYLYILRYIVIDMWGAMCCARIDFDWVPNKNYNYTSLVGYIICKLTDVPTLRVPMII
jgi:hypothetical protein